MLNMRHGFTVAELMIVVAVMAVLASAVLTSYNSVNARGRDAAVRDGAMKIAEATEVFQASNRTNPKAWNTGSGSTAGCMTASASGYGWVAQSVGAYETGYGCTVESWLVVANLLPNGYIDSLPKNKKYPTKLGYTYMIVPCTAAANTDYVLLYSLEQPMQSDISNYNWVASSCPGGGGSPSLATAKTSYNMQGALLINFTE